MVMATTQAEGEIRPWIGRAAISVCLAVIAALTAACDYVRPITAVCESRLKPTEVRVTAAPVDYKTDLSVSSAALTQMAPGGSGRVVQGLTRTSMRSLVNLGTNGITNPFTRRHCLRPVIDVRLAFDPMTVYVSNDQTEGSCQFSVTMQHELQHVAVYRNFLDSAAADIERQLRDYFGNRIFYFDSEADAQTRMRQETSERVGPFVEQSMNLVLEKQAPLDTREDYDRLQRSCSGIFLR